MQRKQLLAAYETARRAEVSARRRLTDAYKAVERAQAVFVRTSTRLSQAYKALEGRE